MSIESWRENREEKNEHDPIGENERARQQREEALRDGYHYENLFDQNEDESGEKINLATGENIRNDHDIESPEINVGANVINMKEDKLRKELEAENDPASKWLRDHGFDELGNETKPRKAA